MKFRTIDIEDTKEGRPYLLFTHPLLHLVTIKVFYAVRCADARNGFRKNYKFCNGVFKRHARWGKNFDIYTLIPFHEELMLNRLLRPFIAMYWTMKNILSCVFKKKNLRTETIWMVQRYVF